MALSLSSLRKIVADKPPRILLYGVPGIGKEQPLTAGILTPSGWRKMGDMHIGQPVCGSDGKIYQVTGVFPQGVKPAYRVTFMDGTSTEAGEEHLWKVRGGHGSRDGWLIRKTADLIKGNSRGRVASHYKIPIHNAVTLAPSGTLPIPPYVMGALLGDGALTGSVVALSAPPAKQAIIERTMALLGDDYEAMPHNEETSSRQFYIKGGERSVSTLAFLIRSMGLDVRSPYRFIPEIYKQSSIADRMELLRGLMDTDGHSNDGRTGFSSFSSHLADDVSNLVRSLGGVAVTKEYNTPKGNEYRVNVRIGECPFTVPYKAQGWRKPAFEYGKKISSIEYIGDVEQQCISVSAPDHLYITDGYNLTHNTTMAAEFPAPVFIQTEEGTPGGVELDSFGTISSFDDVLDTLAALYQEEHAFQTVVIDTLDALEPLVWAHTATENGWKSIEDPGFGKGYVAAENTWHQLVDALNALRNDRGMIVLLLAHSETVRYEPPGMEPYNRFHIKLHKRGAALLQENVDVLAFANYDTVIKKTDTGFNKKVAHAEGGGVRMLYLEERPAFLSKNRYAMPAQVTYKKGKGFAALAPYFPGAPAPAAEEPVAEEAAPAPAKRGAKG